MKRVFLEKRVPILCIQRFIGLALCIFCFFSLLCCSVGIVGIVVALITISYRNESEGNDLPPRIHDNDEIVTMSGYIKTSNDRRSTDEYMVDAVYTRMCSPLSFDSSNYRSKYSVSSSGFFSVEITKHNPWVLVFLHTSSPNLNGSDMIIATFEAISGLDSIYVMSSSSSIFHLGEVVYNSTTSNSSAVAMLKEDMFSSYASFLGLDDDQLSLYASKDSFCLSGSNPDINSDGILDMDQKTIVPQFNLSFILYVEITDFRILSDLKEMKSVIISNTSHNFTNNMSLLGGGPELRTLYSEDDGYMGIFSRNISRWKLSYNTQFDSYVEFNRSFDGIEGIYQTETRNYTFWNTGFRCTLFYSSSEDKFSLPSGTYKYDFFDDNIGESETPTFSNIRLPFDDQYSMNNNSVNQYLHNFLFPFPVFNEDGDGYITNFTYTWVRFNNKNNNSFEVVENEEEVEIHMGRSYFSILWSNSSTGGEEIVWSSFEDIFPSVIGFKISDTVFRKFDAALIKLADISKVRLVVRHLSGVIVDLIIRG